MHLNVVEMFLAIEIFKLNNRMVRLMNSVRACFAEEHECGCCALAEERGIKNE